MIKLFQSNWNNKVMDSNKKIVMETTSSNYLCISCIILVSCNEE